MGNVRKKKHFIVRMASQLAEGPYHAGFVLSWVEQMAGLRKDGLKMGRIDLCRDYKPPDPGGDSWLSENSLSETSVLL